MPPHYDAIIIGAGASGLFCGRMLALAGKKTLILERQPSPGRKLAAAGGGFANFSNLRISPERYVCPGNPGFTRYALRGFGVQDFTSLLSAWNLPFEERAGGKLFLKKPATRLVQALAGDCMAAGAEILENCAAIALAHAENLWQASGHSCVFLGKRLIFAAGSGARPALSGGRDAWRPLASLGVPINAPRPALTPLVFQDKRLKQLFAPLAGLSQVAIVKTGSHLWHGPVLFTHNGLSGPAILNASLRFQDSIEVNFLPGIDFESLLDSAPARTPLSTLRGRMPRRLAEALLPPGLACARNGQISRAARKRLGAAVNALSMTGLILAGLEKAEICAGGAELSAIHPGSLECRDYPGLYIIGEALDVAGELGGFNLHWAWASAALAARNIIKKKASA